MAPIDSVPTDLVPYLLAKPFLILTGPSGTGKTKGVVELATCFDYGAGLPASLEASRETPSTGLAFVPVGADWTDQRHLLGYRNPFGPERKTATGTTNLTYEHTSALRLLLRAAHDFAADEPHFLILDEMNLSHVERYFSSFLSLMEADRSTSGASRFELLSRDDVALLAEVLDSSTHPMEKEAAAALAAAGRGLSLPTNVFVVGTVNVDETTYMFSPKVLDRAFVRELPAVHPSSWLSGGAGASQTAPGTDVAQAFKDAIAQTGQAAGTPLDVVEAGATAAGLPPADASAARDQFETLFAGLFDVLAPVGFSFGYRTVVESARYVSTALTFQALTGVAVDLNAALDDVVLSKVLPKLHGNRRQLAGSLEAAAKFLQAQPAEYELPGGKKVSPTKPISSVLPRSSAKAEELHRRLQATGYATFIA